MHKRPKNKFKLRWVTSGGTFMSVPNPAERARKLGFAKKTVQMLARHELTGELDANERLCGQIGYKIRNAEAKLRNAKKRLQPMEKANEEDC